MPPEQAHGAAEISGVQALILAGGRGQRLHPYTATLPKPLMPIADRTILEVTLGQLREAGVTSATLAVNHLAPLIIAFFDDGSRFGMALSYVTEETPLGTAGPIASLSGVDDTLLVVNADVLSDMDLGEFLRRHRESGAVMSVATQNRRHEMELGLVDVDDNHRVTGFTEKPVTYHRIALGIYALEPEACRLVKPDARMDMPELILALVRDGFHVRAQEHEGHWIDIGRPEDLARAQEFFA